ncbi:MAG: hypothetical protein II244_04575 [Clostridia bacterium]|nr:hypothetical protein [Clostridia bacterium]
MYKNLVMAGFISKSLLSNIQKDMVDALATLGYKAMADAYAKRTFKHRTRNLHDSYGSAVYYDGKVVLSSIKYFGGIYSRGADPRTKKTGRETLNNYFRTHSFGATRHEIVLVVVAAMYYAGILENANKNMLARGPGDRYIVISPAHEYINTHYQSALQKVYQKYGIKEKPVTRVIKGEKLSR